MWALLVVLILKGEIVSESLQVYRGFDSAEACFQEAEWANNMMNKNYDPEKPFQVIYACGLIPDRVEARNN